LYLTITKKASSDNTILAGDIKLYIPKGDTAYGALKPMIGATRNIKHVRTH